MTPSLPSDTPHFHAHSGDHHHDHGHHHAPEKDRHLPSLTLMQASAVARLVGAVAMLIPIWVAVYWAVLS